MHIAGTKMRGYLVFLHIIQRFVKVLSYAQTERVRKCYNKYIVRMLIWG